MGVGGRMGKRWVGHFGNFKFHKGGRGSAENFGLRDERSSESFLIKYIFSFLHKTSRSGGKRAPGPLQVLSRSSCWGSGGNDWNRFQNRDFTFQAGNRNWHWPRFKNPVHIQVGKIVIWCQFDTKLCHWCLKLHVYQIMINASEQKIWRWIGNNPSLRSTLH